MIKMLGLTSIVVCLAIPAFADDQPVSASSSPITPLLEMNCAGKLGATHYDYTFHRDTTGNVIVGACSGYGDSRVCVAAFNGKPYVHPLLAGVLGHAWKMPLSSGAGSVDMDPGPNGSLIVHIGNFTSDFACSKPTKPYPFDKM